VRSGAAVVVLICALLASRGLLSSPVTAGALSVLPDTSDGIHRGAIFVHCYQEFGSFAGTSPSCQRSGTTSVTTLEGKVDTGFLWSNAPFMTFVDPKLAGQIGVALQFTRFPKYGFDYSRFDQADFLSPAANPPNGLNSWKASHPDWIEYQCDKTTPAWEFTQPATPDAPAFVPFDTANPAAQDFYFTTYVQPALQHGAALIFFDNGTTANPFRRCGHYDLSGTWVQEWTGDPAQPAYQSSLFSWQQYLYSHIKAINPNAIVAFNYDPAAAGDPPSAYTQFLKQTDLLLNEAGFNNFGQARYASDDSKQLWLAEQRVNQTAQSLGVATLHSELIPVTDPANISLDEKNWAIGNYLLFKGSHDYLSMNAMLNGGGDYGANTDVPEYATPIGHATGALYQSQNVYMRNYSNGLVLVNPSATSSFTVTLPATFTNLGGQAVGPMLTLAPTTAAVLYGPSVITPPNFRAGASTSSSVSMQWDTVPQADYYQVAYRQASVSSYTLVNTGTQSSDTVSNLPSSTTVYAYVQACTQAWGCSQWAGYLTLATTAAPEGPPPPTSLRAGATTSSSAQVIWDAAGGATDYQVAYRQQSQTSYTVVDAGSTTSYTIAGLPAKTVVYAYVQACNSAGCSAWAGYATLQTAAQSAPLAPANLRAGSSTPSSVQVSWDAAGGAIDYQVAYRQQSQASYTVVDVGNNTSYTILGLPSGTTVYAYAQACNNAGCSPWAGYVTLRTN
jgi:hypothetical protein